MSEQTTTEAPVDTAGAATETARPDAGRLQARIIINPYSSGLTSVREKAIVMTLRDYVDLDVRRTERGGHAQELARDAVEDGFDLIMTVGGDGTANEALNGMSLADGTADKRPMFALVPAGGTNVLCRSLGMPNDPVKATVHLATAITARRCKPINLGKLDERIFMFAAGVGLDGAVVRRIEQKRRGRRPSDLSHLSTIVGLFANERFALGERMTITIPETGEELRGAMLMCGNTRPMTYMGRVALDFMPEASLQDGLDFIAPKRLNAFFAIRNSMDAMGVGGRKRHLVSPEAKQLRHDVDHFSIVCDSPQAVQVDGEYIGDRTHIELSTVRDAVRLVY